MADLSGLTGGVLVGGTPRGFSKWKLSCKTKAVIRNNWLCSGFQRLVAGFTDGTITISGPYDGGNMPVVCGGVYVFTLQWTANLAIAVTAQVESLDPDNDAEDGPNLSVTAKSTGIFSALVT